MVIYMDLCCELGCCVPAADPPHGQVRYVQLVHVLRAHHFNPFQFMLKLSCHERNI
jgi:hypothetical protein